MSFIDINKLKEKGKEFISQKKEQVANSVKSIGIGSVPEQFKRFNDNLEKVKREDIEFFKQEISKITNSAWMDKIPNEIIKFNDNVEYFKQSIKIINALKTIFIVIAVLLFVLIIVLVVK